MWLTGLVALQHVGSSQTRARTHVPCISRQILNHCATREAPRSLGFVISEMCKRIECQPRSCWEDPRANEMGTLGAVPAHSRDSRESVPFLSFPSLPLHCPYGSAGAIPSAAKALLQPSWSFQILSTPLPWDPSSPAQSRHS